MATPPPLDCLLFVIRVKPGSVRSGQGFSVNQVSERHTTETLLLILSSNDVKFFKISVQASNVKVHDKESIFLQCSFHRQIDFRYNIDLLCLVHYHLHQNCILNRVGFY